MTNTLPALAMDENTLIAVLENSLYPGANPTSIALVINYCQAAGLDPMQKPVHIVPMWDSKAQRTRDVVMPGVGLYRTQAARTGLYAGVTEPEFGPDTTETIGGVDITFPAWCRVSVRRQLPNGTIVDFTAVERWKENYAVAGGKEKSIAPNAMWKRRPYAQLAKCAEAQALRKAFPEMTGAQPTADEMEGRSLDEFEGATIDNATGEVKMPKSKREQAPTDAPKQTQAPGQIAPAGPLSAGQIAYLRRKLADAQIAETTICERFGIAKLEDITAADWDTVKSELLATA